MEPAYTREDLKRTLCEQALPEQGEAFDPDQAQQKASSWRVENMTPEQMIEDA